MVKKSSIQALPAVEEARLLQVLQQMERDSTYNTKSRYSGNTEKYPDNTITFSQWHMSHIKKFPNLNPTQYISNLKLMTKIR